VDLPAFRHDTLRLSISGGDLGIQVCANDPQEAFHAVHELIRLARPLARPRWLLAGFGRTGNSLSQSIPRNCYQRDPRRQFIPIQRQLAALDSLNQFISHIGSAIFACPPGGAPGAYVGEGLLG
jgi:deferrochelatase/peroxidase EfeB